MLPQKVSVKKRNRRQGELSAVRGVMRKEKKEKEKGDYFGETISPGTLNSIRDTCVDFIKKTCTNCK